MVADSNPNQRFVVGPVKLSGEKDGAEFQIDLGRFRNHFFQEKLSLR